MKINHSVWFSAEKREKLVIFIKMPYFWSSISHNFGDEDKIQSMDNANQYIVNQSQLTNFFSIPNKKVSHQVAFFYNVQ